MKKSNLRKIIKESIKKLMTEQSSNERCMRIRSCWGGQSRYRFGTVNGGIPQAGQVLDWVVLNRPQYVHKVYTPGNEPSSCHNQSFNLYQGTTCCPHVCGTSTSSISSGIGFTPGMNNVGCSGNGSMCCGNSNYNASTNSNCPTTTSAGSCNPSAWSNHANWTSTFTNTVNNLNPNNPNQPCNFLNNKIAQFTANLQGTGQGGYQNMQNCKLDLATQLHAQNNC
jgi:hypothetical protein